MTAARVHMQIAKLLGRLEERDGRNEMEELLTKRKTQDTKA